MSQTKACPFCGEEVLAVAVKCKHCGSAIAGQPLKDQSQLRMRPAFSTGALIVLSLIAIAFVYNWSQTGTVSGRGFTEADVKNIESSIREEFSKKRGVTVDDVQMIRESPTRMTGFVKVRVPILGAMQKTCSANFGEEGRSIWSCG